MSYHLYVNISLLTRRRRNNRTNSYRRPWRRTRTHEITSKQQSNTSYKESMSIQTATTSQTNTHGD